VVQHDEGKDTATVLLDMRPAGRDLTPLQELQIRMNAAGSSAESAFSISAPVACLWLPAYKTFT
jgi:hypothetical protein